MHYTIPQTLFYLQGPYNPSSSQVSGNMLVDGHVDQKVWVPSSDPSPFQAEWILATQPRPALKLTVDPKAITGLYKDPY